MSPSSTGLNRERPDLEPQQKADGTDESSDYFAGKWICGRLETDGPCSEGPDRRGRCSHVHECAPLKRGGEWLCAGPAARGGQCPHGPQADGTCCHRLPACKPRLSLRARRARLARWVAALTFAAIAFFVTWSNKGQFLMPGPLSAAHSQSGACSDCHSRDAPGRLAWLHNIFAKATPREDSAACLVCHKAGPAALNPHGLGADELEAITRRLSAFAKSNPAPLSAKIRDTVFPFREALSKGVFCAICHKEHKGRDFDMTAMSDARCGTCHVAKFAGFGDGHPAFSTYPSEHRTAINFDHAGHFGKHFPKLLAENDRSKTPPKMCVDCHQADQTGTAMQMRPFAQICASCHASQIVGADRASGPKGISVFTLPGIDIDTLQERNAATGEWPASSEAGISPFMELLIGQTGDHRQLLNTIGKLDLLDLSEASDGDIAAVEKFIWEVKTLLYALSRSMMPDIRARLGAAAGGEVAPELLAKLTAGLPRDVLMSARAEWLPNLDAEIAAHRRGERVATRAMDQTKQPDTKTKPIVDAESWAEHGGWYRQDHAILYRPAGHDDPFMRAWLTFTAGQPGKSGTTLLAPVFDSLTNKNAQGQCTKCHSVDRLDSGRRWVNWTPVRKSLSSPQFTAFSHKPHFAVSGKKGCRTCHEINRNADYLKTYKGHDPTAFDSNFKPIRKQICATCHRPGGAGEKCQTCHRYHATVIKTPASETRISR